MVQGLQQALLAQGYNSRGIQPDTLGLYSQETESGTRVILSVDSTRGVPVTPEQLFHIRNKIDGYFPNAQILALVWMKNAETGSSICAQNENTWIIDVLSGRIMIYENQPGDFYGLKSTVEDLYQNGQNPPLVRGSGQKSVGVVTLILIVLNVLIFLWMELAGDTTNSIFMLEHGAMYPESILSGGEYYRFFTEMFIHFGPQHLFNNMLILFFMGSSVERAVGRIKYLGIYFVSGLCASTLSFLSMVQTGNWAVCGGASGAIFGVIGALLYIVIRNKGRLEDITTGRLVFMIVLTLYYGFTSTGIDNMAHLGGLLSGCLLGILLYRRQRK